MLDSDSMLSVLVVCTGNICRSPIAEGLFRDRGTALAGEDLEVRSAGTWAGRRNPAMPEAVRAAAELGSDVAGHRSQRVTPTLAGAADLVITMTEEQRDEVIREAPGAARHTFTLKELAALLGQMPAAAWPPDTDATRHRIEDAHRLRVGPAAPAIADTDVTDPIGMGMEVYRAVAWDIERHIDAVLPALLGTPRSDTANRPARASGE